MRKLSSLRNNVFTPKIYDIILPRQAFSDLNKSTMQEKMALVDDSNTLKKIFNLHHNQDINL